MTRITTIGLCALLAALVAAGPAAASARLVEDSDHTDLVWPNLACGESSTQTVWLGQRVESVDVHGPVAGTKLTAYIGRQHLATVVAVETITEGERTGVRVTVAGDGVRCGGDPYGLYADDTPENLRVDIAYAQWLSPSAWSGCGSLPWRSKPRKVERNGHVGCPKAFALARAWRRAHHRRVRRDCGHCTLPPTKLRGFRCVHRPDAVVCRQGRRAAAWYAPRPRKPKPPPKPIPGPLGWGEAKKAALRIANNFPIYAEKRKVTWCNRWSKWEVHCGVRGWNLDYEGYMEESCSATAYVTKRPGRRAKVRTTDDLSCFYG